MLMVLKADYKKAQKYSNIVTFSSVVVSFGAESKYFFTYKYLQKTHPGSTGRTQPGFELKTFFTQVNQVKQHTHTRRSFLL